MAKQSREVCYGKVFTGADTEKSFYENSLFMDATFTPPGFNKDNPIVFKDVTFAASQQPLAGTFQLPNMQGVICENVILDGLHHGRPSTVSCGRFSGIEMRNGKLSYLVFSGTKNDPLVNADFGGNRFTDVAFVGEGSQPFEIRGGSFSGIKAVNFQLGNVKLKNAVSFINIEKIDDLYFSGPVNLREGKFGGYEEGKAKLSREHVVDLQKRFDNLCDNNYHSSPAMLLNTLGTIQHIELQRDLKEQVVGFFLDTPELEHALAHSDALRQSMLGHLINMSAQSEVIRHFLHDKVIHYHGQALITDAERTNISTLLSSLAPEKLLEHQFLVNQLRDIRQAMNKEPSIKEFMDYARTLDKSGKEGVIFYFPESEQAIYIKADEFDSLINGEVPPQHAHLLTRIADEKRIMVTPLIDMKRQKLLQNYPTLESLWSGRGTKLAEIISPLFDASAHMEAHADNISRLKSLILMQLTKNAREKLNLESPEDIALLKEWPLFMSHNRDTVEVSFNKRTALVEQVCRQLDWNKSGLDPAQQKLVASLLLARTFITLFSPEHCSTDNFTHDWLLSFARQFLVDTYQHCPALALSSDIDTVITQANENRFAAALYLLDTLQFNGDSGAVISKLIHQHSPVF